MRAELKGWVLQRLSNPNPSPNSILNADPNPYPSPSPNPNPKQVLQRLAILKQVNSKLKGEL